MAIGDWLGSLFGGTPTYTPQPGGTDTPPGTLAGLLDPRGIREQAAWSGLGALSAGLIAAGQRRPAASPSLFPQALGAFGPAYQGALQSGYQTAGAEQQFRQREAAERTRLEREQAWQTALQAATPAERGLMQQMGPDQWAQMQGNVQAALRRPTAVGQGQSLVIPQTNQTIASVPPAPEPLQFHRNPDGTFTVIDPSQIPGGRGPPAGGQSPAVGGAQPGVTGRAPPENVGGLIVPGSGTGPANPIRYQQFASAEEGRAAAEQQLVRNAQRISSAGQPVTLQTLIGGAPGAPYGWAPGGVHGNDPVAYVRNLSMWTGLRPDQPLDLNNPQVRQAILAGIVRQEGVAASAARGGGGTRGGAQPPATDPGIGEGGTTVSMTPGARPLVTGTTPDQMVPIGPGSPPLPELAVGRNMIAALAGPQVPPQPSAQPPQVQPPQARPAAAPPQPPQQPGIRTIGTPRQGPAAPFGSGEASLAYGVITDPSSDPSSEIYSAAWNIVSRGVPVLGPDPRPGAPPGSLVQTYIQPDMRRFRQPGSGGAGGGATPPPATAPAPDGAAAPPAAALAAPATPAATAPPAGGPPGTRQAMPVEGTGRPAPHTAEQAVTAGFATRMIAANDIIARLESQGYRPSDWDLALMQTGQIGNVAMNPQARQYHQAARDWLLANLRKETGAVIGPSELPDQMRLYFPTIQDDAGTITQKAEARRRVEEGMARSGGSAYQSPLVTIPPADRIPMLPTPDLLALGNSYHRMNDAQRRAFERAVLAIRNAGGQQ